MLRKLAEVSARLSLLKGLGGWGRFLTTGKRQVSHPSAKRRV